MDIVIRAIFIFFFLWLVTRAVGRTTLGELSAFQLVMFVTIGDLSQQAVTQQDFSLTGAVLAVGTFALLTVVISWATYRWPRRLLWVRGAPVIVIREGELVLPAMRNHRLSLDDLRAAARQDGVRRLADVEVAVLEADGRISFFERDDTTA